VKLNKGLLHWFMELLFGPTCTFPGCYVLPAARCERNECIVHCDQWCKCGRELSEDEKEVIHEMRRFRRAGKN
jgi:hypothetical protein